ncbi:MAG: hypothetical protein PHE83_18050 [Opitutaceae bacterium]|nr:hypothetical protein [Opitutaceae bacterium]
MNTPRLYLMLFLGAATAVASDAPAVLSMAGLRENSRPVPVQTVSAPERVIVGDPTSSLSREEAIRIAQKAAAAIPGSGVAQIDPGYNGCLAPAIPANAVLVVEPVHFEQLKPFDLVLFTAPSGEIRARRILAKGFDKAVVGFEYNEVTPGDVDAQAFIGRVVMVLLYDPKAKSTGN